MTFPAAEPPTVSSFNTNATSHLVAMPAVVNAGELLVCLFSNDGAAVPAPPSGWVRVWDLDNVQVRASVFLKAAAGTEGGTSPDFVTGVAERAAAQVYRVRDWYGGTISGVENVGYSVEGSLAVDAAPNPPWKQAGAWGLDDTFWIAFYAADGDQTCTTYPPDYMGGTFTESDNNAESSSLGSAWRQLTAQFEHPGPFAIAAAEDWVGVSIAIRPSNPGTGTSIESQPRQHAQAITS